MTDRRHGGYRHGVPGGDAAKLKVEARVMPDVKERWEAEAKRRGYGPREFTAFLIEMVELGIAVSDPDKPER